MVELTLVASILVSMNYTIMQSLMLASMFLPVLLAALFVADTAIGKQLDKRFGKTPSCITFYSDRKSVTLQTEQILYVESNDAETWVHTLDGEHYRNKTTISQWEQILEDGFLRTHRSFLVNLNYVTKVDSDAVMLADITIPVSRKYKEVVAVKITTTT